MIRGTASAAGKPIKCGCIRKQVKDQSKCASLRKIESIYVKVTSSKDASTKSQCGQIVPLKIPNKKFSESKIIQKSQKSIFFRKMSCFVTKCLADGSFSPVQCFGSKCWCIDQNGNFLDGSRSWDSWGKALDCTVKPLSPCSIARAGDKKKCNGKGCFETKCNEDGSFYHQQCFGSKCWCVNTDGKKITGTTRKIGSSIDCACYRRHALSGKMIEPCESSSETPVTTKSPTFYNPSPASYLGVNLLWLSSLMVLVAIVLIM